VFDHILIALDGSEEARSAGALGLRVAKKLESRVTGLSVIDVRVVEGPAVETLSPLWGEVTGRPFQPEVMRLYRERADSVLDDFCAAAEDTGLDRIERCSEIGVAEDAILDRATEADLLGMGRGGEHAGFGRRALGATLWRVLHRAPCPVLIGGEVVVADGEAIAGSIPRLPLVAWDCSPCGKRALDLAVRFAAAMSGKLCIVHAGSESADSDMDEAHGALSGSTVAWESARLDLDPAEAVEEARVRWDTDCLFMGAFGRGRLRDLLFGSHTAQILECSAGPVFVTP
jgi:nucleotide-binding universal stress UspA family protein